MTDHPHHRWLLETEEQIRRDYDRLHTMAYTDPQRAGHGGESTWAELLTDSLPPSYEVVTRKYIVPEHGDDTFETDVVVLSPGYPPALRDREEIMAGGVAAAFSVKLTLDASGLTDAIDRASRLRRALQPPSATLRGQMLGAFPVGLLAHAHTWTSAGSDPAANITRALEHGHAGLKHPREIVDFVCVANLGTWVASRIPHLSASATAHNAGATDAQRCHGAAMTAVTAATTSNSSNPVAVLVAHIFARLSYDDPSLRSMANSFRTTGTMGQGSGRMRLWDLDVVFSDDVRKDLSIRGVSRNDADWQPFYF